MTTFRPLRLIYEGGPEIPTKLAEFGQAGDAFDMSLPIDYGKTSKLAQSGALVADFDDGTVQYFELNGHVTDWTTANRALASSSSRETRIVVSPGAGTRNLAFDAGWTFIGSAAPTDIASGKTGMLTLLCIGAGETDVIASWSVAP